LKNKIKLSLNSSMWHLFYRLKAGGWWHILENINLQVLKDHAFKNFTKADRYHIVDDSILPRHEFALERYFQVLPVNIKEYIAITLPTNIGRVIDRLSVSLDWLPVWNQEGIDGVNKEWLQCAYCKKKPACTCTCQRCGEFLVIKRGEKWICWYCTGVV